MKSGSTAALIACAALAVGLSACGGSGSSSSSEGSAPATSAESSTESTPTGGLTPSGAKLKVGEAATVSYVPYEEQDPAKSQPGIKVKVTVTAIEEKSLSDLDELELGPEEKEKTPFFVKLELEALSSEAGDVETENPATRVDLVDDRDQSLTFVSIFGEFSPCEDERPPTDFVDGASFEPCFVYLVHQGGSIKEAKWSSGPLEKGLINEYFEHPVTWTAAG